MTNNLHRRPKADVLAALAAGPGRPAEIQKRMGKWAVITVRHSLRELAIEGKIAFDGDVGQRVYRLAPAGDLGAA